MSVSSPTGWSAWRWPLVLLAVTALTTTLAQGPMAGASWGQGLAYAATLLGILGAHEMGHFLAALKLGVPASPPHFIPLPPLPAFSLGTLGAVIRMEGGPARRGPLLVIGAAGPLAGFVVAVPAMILGLRLSTPTPLEGTEGLVFFGSSLVSWGLEALFAPPLAAGEELFVHPVYIAAWAGFLVTALNLLPMGQLDGGHVVHALWPEGAPRVAKIVQVSLLVLGTAGLLVNAAEWVSPELARQLSFLRPWLSPGLLLWAGLATWLGLEHPPTEADHRPLETGHYLMAGACLLVLLGCFMPSPIYTMPA